MSNDLYLESQTISRADTAAGRKKIKILMGGSPCTFWSIAQTKNRETKAEGYGWELFKNFLIAKEKFKPDYFLYENNKSAAQEIKDQISDELGVNREGTDNGVRFTYINSALLSAQNRQRFYVTNFGDIGQPTNRGIVLRDIIESGVAFNEKSYCLTASYSNACAWNTLERNQRSMIAEPVAIAEQPVNRQKNEEGEWERIYEAREDNKANCLTTNLRRSMVAEPIKVGDFEKKFQGYGIYSLEGKAIATTASGGGAGGHSGLYAIPADEIAEPIRIGDIGSTGQAHRVYSPESTGVTLKAFSGGQGGKTGLYAIPVNQEDVAILQNPHGFNKGGIKYDKAPTLTANGQWEDNNKLIYPVDVDGTENEIKVHLPDAKSTITIYKVINGIITIRNKRYPIKLNDGYYIIRKLTVLECRRLQTVPDWYVMPCSASQNYKLLGNGWTVEVIKHLLGHIPHIQDCDIEVLSMYDGMSCGQIALKELGCNITKYVSHEIDKYAIQTTLTNFPNTDQRGDAFNIRENDWIY